MFRVGIALRAVQPLLRDVCRHDVVLLDDTGAHHEPDDAALAVCFLPETGADGIEVLEGLLKGISNDLTRLVLGPHSDDCSSWRPLLVAFIRSGETEERSRRKFGEPRDAGDHDVLIEQAECDSAQDPEPVRNLLELLR